jgi:hypothetical protein
VAVVPLLSLPLLNPPNLLPLSLPNPLPLSRPKPLVKLKALLLLPKVVESWKV